MKYWSIFIFVFITAFAIYFVLFSETAEKNATNTFVVAIAADNPPFAFINTEEGGTPQGFEIDLIQALAKKMEMTPEIRDMDFPNIIASLQSRRVDMGVAGFEQTPERSKNVDFSIPYYAAQRTILSLSPIQAPPVNWDTKKVGVQLGSAHETFLRTLQMQYPALQIVSYNRIGEIVQDLKNKRVDWILVDRSLAKQLTQKEFFYQFELALSGDVYMIAFPKNSPFLEQTNRALEQLQKEGEIERLVSKWIDN